MPDDKHDQDQLAANTFLSNCVHIKCSDGTYYCVLGDIINEQSPTTFVRPGTAEYNKVIQMLETGEASIDQQVKLKSV